MKKIFSVLAILSFLAVVAAPVAVLAVVETVPPTATGCTLRHDFSGAAWKDKGFTCPSSGTCLFENATGVTNTCGTCCVLDSIYTVTDWVFVGIMSLAILMMIWGAFQIITAGGAAEKVTTGRTFILWAAVGFVIAMIARAIPSIARGVLGI